MHTLCEVGGGGGHRYVDQLKKLPSKWCILKDVLTYFLGNREETNAQLQSVNLFIARNTYEVAILGIF